MASTDARLEPLSDVVLPAARLRIFGLNVGHFYTHYFMLIYPTVVLSLEAELGLAYGDLLMPSTVGFATYALGAYPAGWLGDRWSRRAMMILMFIGLALGCFVTSAFSSLWGIALGLGLIGSFAAIYHPVGIAMLVEEARPVGRALGINGVWGNLGVAAAPIVTAAITAAFGWRWAFLLPGFVALATGIAFALLPPPTRAEQAERDAAGGKLEVEASARDRMRVVIYVGLGVMLYGLIFSVTTVTLPKLVDEQVGPVLTGAWAGVIGAAGLASLIFVFGAFAQILVGNLLDRYPTRPIAVIVALLMAPFLAMAAWFAGWFALPPIMLMMLLVFGMIPIKDSLIARYTTKAVRARIYAISYLLGSLVSVATVPLIAALHDTSGNFLSLYLLLALLAVSTAAAALILPRPPGRAAAQT